MSSEKTPDLPFKVEGISWHALTLEAAALDSMKKMMTEHLGISPVIDQPGFVMFDLPNGTMLELYAPQNVPAYGFNEGVAFGYWVDDIEAASKSLEKAGYELLGDITHMEQMKYAYPYFKSKGITYSYRHFRAQDGRVYGLNEHKSE